jgi:hypothetical protein
MARSLLVIFGVLILVNVCLGGYYFFLANKSNQDVVITSQIPSVTASINLNAIENGLKDLQFFGKDKVIFYDAKGMQKQMITVKKVQVFLTDKEQGIAILGSKDANGNISYYTSYSSQYDPNTQILSLYLYVAPNLVQKEDTNRVSARFSSTLRYVTWDLTHPFKNSDTSPNDRFVGYKDFVNKYKTTNWITIKK